jgi:preprotein translocase subunit SecG
MQTFLSPVLLTVHLMLTVALIGVVLLQKSEGGLGGLGGGMSGFMTTRGSTNLLTKITRWLAAGFMATSLTLAWISSHSHIAPASFTEQPAPLTPPAGQAPAPANQPAPSPATAPSGQNGGGGTAPTAPTAPAAPTNQ